MRFSFPLSRKPGGNSTIKRVSNSKMKLAIGLAASVLILATVTAATFRSTRITTISRSVVATANPRAPVVQGSSNRTAEALPIQLKAGGFVPREISKPKGDYFFSIQNTSGQDEILLRLERTNGERVHEVNLNKQKRSWRKLVHLAPGTYLITEANHPTWVCRISITAQ